MRTIEAFSSEHKLITVADVARQTEIHAPLSASKRPTTLISTANVFKTIRPIVEDSAGALLARIHWSGGLCAVISAMGSATSDRRIRRAAQSDFLTLADARQRIVLELIHAAFTTKLRL